MGTVQTLNDILLRPVHWTEALPVALRQIGVDDLLVPLGLDFESYSTARMMARDAKETRRIIGKVDPPVGVKGGLVLLECLPFRAGAELEAMGLSLHRVDESAVLAEIDVLRQAWYFIHAVWPELSSSVEHLVRCIHLLKAPSPDVDCSFSRPDLPFSVFLSIPDQGSHARIERVAEALVHETMHLQLSLLERRIQFVESDLSGAVAFSPWRNGERNVQGVLHALYVFVIVHKLWRLVVRKSPSGLDQRFAEGRVRTISDEFERAQLLLASPGITHEGRELVCQLLALGRSPLGDCTAALDMDTTACGC